jgi:hypothetical protein
MSCGCGSDNESYSPVYNKNKQKGYLNIEGFTTQTNDSPSYFQQKYKQYLESQNKKGLDKHAMSFFENFDENTKQMLNKNAENNKLRDELNIKMKEVYNTLQSNSHEQEKINFMYKVRDVMLYSMSGVILYYIFVEL